MSKPKRNQKSPTVDVMGATMTKQSEPFYVHTIHGMSQIIGNKLILPGYEDYQFIIWLNAESSTVYVVTELTSGDTVAFGVDPDSAVFGALFILNQQGRDGLQAKLDKRRKAVA